MMVHRYDRMTCLLILARLLSLLRKPAYCGWVGPQVALEGYQGDLHSRTQLDNLLDPLGFDIFE